MAKADWVLVNPASGSGDKAVNVSSAAVHTGRNPRTSAITFKAANCTDVVRNVIQAGKPEFVDFNDDTSSVEKSGKVVTLSGTSNSSKLTFKLGTGDIELSLPATYTANSLTVQNGENIEGDPGATAEYTFSIKITVPANEDITEKTRQIIVTDDGGHQDICTIELAAGDPYLTVDEGDINLDYNGTAVSVNVKSNTSWTIS